MTIHKTIKQYILEESFSKYYERLTYYRIFSIIDNGNNFFRLVNVNRELKNSSLILKNYIIKHKNFSLNYRNNNFIRKKTCLSLNLNDHVLLKHNSILKFNNACPIIVPMFDSFYVGVIHNKKPYKCSKENFNYYYEDLISKLFINEHYLKNQSNLKQNLIKSIVRKINIIDYSLVFVKINLKSRKRRNRLKFFFLLKLLKLKKRKKKIYLLKKKRKKKVYTNLLINNLSENTEWYSNMVIKYNKLFYIKKKKIMNNHSLFNILNIDESDTKDDLLNYLEEQEEV